MRITQAYISPSVADFPFLRCLNLEPYHDVTSPAVFYGCYTMLDLMKVLNHRGAAVIRWCGQDAFDFRHWEMVMHCRHVTPLTGVCDWINFLNTVSTCKKIKPEGLDMSVNATPKGENVYAYVPASFPEYHGSDIIKQLSLDNLITGEGLCSQKEWYTGICNGYYDPAFIGLMLSPFAGGGQSVIDMGLRGKKCITNVIDLPNVIHWESLDDIRNAIDQEAKTIGETDSDLAQRVFDAIDKNYDWLDTDFYY